MNIRILVTTLAFAEISSALAAASTPTDWMLGPFARPAKAQPVIRPSQVSIFNCPMNGKPIRWEATHTFNPAAIVKDGKVYLLYRAEDDNGKGIGGFTSRLGLAVSDDGIHFTKMPAPVLYPDTDAQKGQEWNGGCEDPRIVETDDRTYVLFYTQYRRLPGQTRHTDLGMATSKDLVHWNKAGPVIGRDAKGQETSPSKSASLVTFVRDGRLIAARINGKYWLYYGEGTIRLLSSKDLRDWTPEGGALLAPRQGLFDSDLAECGPPAVLTSKGIVLLYNGKNARSDKADPNLKIGIYTDGQALFDAHDPTRLLARTDQPFFRPELPWEMTGQYGDGTTFIEGLVLFKGQWLLYYGCADTYVGVCMADVRPGEIQPATAH